MPLQWRNQFWQSLEEGAGKRCSECDVHRDLLDIHPRAMRTYCIITCAKGKKSFSNRKSAGHFQAFYLITSFPLIVLTRWAKPVVEEDKFLLELCFRLFLCVSVSL